MTSHRPSPLTATALTEPVCPLRTRAVFSGSLAVRSQSRAVLSPLPVTSHRPSPLIATAYDLARVPAQDACGLLRLLGGEVPEPRGVVTAPRDEPPAVAADRDRNDRARVPAQDASGLLRLLGGEVPEPRGFVISSP